MIVSQDVLTTPTVIKSDCESRCSDNTNCFENKYILCPIENHKWQEVMMHIYCKSFACKISVGTLNQLAFTSLCNQIRVWDCVCIEFLSNIWIGQQNQIKVQKLLSNLIGTVKSINSTKAGNLIVECNDNQQYKTLLKSTHLGEWVIKVYVPKPINTSTPQI